LQPIKAPAKVHVKAILNVRMFFSIIWCQSASWAGRSPMAPHDHRAQESALPSEADIGSASQHVRLGPEGDITRLFDHLIRAA
jgi:hypothetical protein